MYVDFAINSTGDLLFTKSDDNYKPLNIKFNISNTKVQKIMFSTNSNNEVKHQSDNYLKISFLLENIKNKSTAFNYKDKDALTQLITLQLKTPLGELPYRTEDGSKLILFKHQNINENVLDELQVYMQSFLSSYILDPVVIAKPIIDYTNGYKQTIELYVYDKNNLLLQYKIES